MYSINELNLYLLFLGPWARDHGPGRGPGRPRRPFPNFRGGSSGSQSRQIAFQRGSRRGPWGSWGCKNVKQRPQVHFQNLKNKLFFIAILDRSLRQSVRNATEGVQNRRSANRSETLASFRRAVGGPGSPRREPWGVPGGPLGVQGAIPGRQGVLHHCLTVLLWVSDVHWGE